MDYVSKLLREGIQTKIVGSHIQYYETIGSTMDEVHVLARNGWSEGLVIVADNQLLGRGRKGTSWISEPGNLLLSILLKPDVKHLEVLQPMTAICVQKAVRAITDIDMNLKWPNDLIVRQTKVGGILLESSVKNDCLEYVVIGIGVNLMLSKKPHNPNYIVSDLSEFGAKTLDRSSLLREILSNLDSYYSKIDKPVEIFEEWKDQLDIIGQFVRFKSGEDVHKGEVISVGDNGSLGLRVANGGIMNFTTGDIIEVYE